MKVLFPAILNKVGSLKDRSYKLEFVTRELRGADAANLFSNLMDEGWVIWAPADEMPDEKDIPSESSDSGAGQKSPSQRLRSVLFLLWKQNGEKGEFNGFYATMVERYIETIKERLDQ